MRANSFEEMLVLVVEGDTRRRGSFSTLAKSLNIRANCVADYRDAIDCLNSSAYSFVFIEFGADDLEALACIKSIRMNAARLGRATPVIALVTELTPETRTRLYSSGISDVLERPLTAGALQAVLSRFRSNVA